MTTDGKISLAVLAGDGIGPEITAATVRVLQAAAARSRENTEGLPGPVDRVSAAVDAVFA
jgi:isocitrate/isopropylmalate dehydrogenase